MVPKTMATMPPAKPAMARIGRTRTRQPTGSAHFQLRLHHEGCCAGVMGMVMALSSKEVAGWPEGFYDNGHITSEVPMRCRSLLVLPLALLACRPSGPEPLSVRQPLHLEEHLGAARITGSEVP